jgi:hypothetical protein
MVSLRGQPLFFVVIMLTSWTGARVIINDLDVLPMISQPAIAAQPIQQLVVLPQPDTDATAKSHRLARPVHDYRKAMGRAPFYPVSPPALVPWQDGGRPSGLSMPALVAGGSKPISTGRDTPPTNADALMGKAGTPSEKRRWGADVYAYSFWRFATAEQSLLATGAQYGGSQSGFVADLDPFGDPNRGIAFLARGAVTPDGNERELALGLRWKPDSNWPFLLSAERRFRADAPDRFAAYLSGGVDTLSLTGKWQLDAYAQAGYATGRGGGGFFDGQARVTRPIAKVAGVPLSIGAGSWAGGQRGTKRLDAGPTAVARVDTGPATVIIQLDWRLRAAGNAEPKDGVALTVSTGF